MEFQVTVIFFFLPKGNTRQMELGPSHPAPPSGGVWISGLFLWVGLHFEAQICDRIAGELKALRLLAQKDQSKSSCTNDLIFGEKLR